MSNIATYNSSRETPISYAVKQDFTAKIEQFVQHLHDFIPVIQAEFDDLDKKAEIKPCKAFDDKRNGLAAIFRAEKDLYYWYVENRKRSA